jgi:hypothetical protein
LLQPGGQGGTVHIVNLMTQEPSPHQAGHPGKAELGIPVFVYTRYQPNLTADEAL